MQKANKRVSKKYVAIKIGTYTVYISLVVPVKINFKSRTSEKARNSKTLLTTPSHNKPGILARQHCNFWNNDIRVLSELKFLSVVKKYLQYTRNTLNITIEKDQWMFSWVWKWKVYLISNYVSDYDATFKF